MKKLIALLILVAALWTVTTYYNALCMEYGFDDAVFTAKGVYCHTHKVEIVHPYMSLKSIVEREKKPKFDRLAPAPIWRQL